MPCVPTTWQACRHGHLSTVKLLLRRGADGGLGDVRGDTAGVASRSTCPPCLAAPGSATFDAACRAHVCTHNLLAAHLAARHGHLDVLAALLQAGESELARWCLWAGMEQLTLRQVFLSLPLPLPMQTTRQR